MYVRPTFRKSRMGASAWDVRSYNYTFRPCVRHRTASLCGSIAYGYLDGCFSTACSPVQHLDSRTIHFLCVSDLDGTPVWYYRILTTLCARLVLVHKECRHVNENAHRAHFAETAHPAADFFFAMNGSRALSTFLRPGVSQ